MLLLLLVPLAAYSQEPETTEAVVGVFTSRDCIGLQILPLTETAFDAAIEVAAECLKNGATIVIRESSVDIALADDELRARRGETFVFIERTFILPKTYALAIGELQWEEVIKKHGETYKKFAASHH